MSGNTKVSHSARSKLFANAKKAALNARRSMWDLVEAIGEIQDALGSQAVLQAEVADSIGFSRGYVSKLFTIASQPVLVKHRALKTLPTSVNDLYALARLGKKMSRMPDGEDKYARALTQLKPNTPIGDLHKRLLPKPKGHLTKELGNTIAKESGEAEALSIAELAQSSDRYFTIFIQPSKALLKFVEDNRLRPSEIARQYPLASVFPHGQDARLFVYTHAEQADVGMRLMDAFGFTLFEMFCPNDGESGSVSQLSSENVLLHSVKARGGKRRLIRDFEDLSLDSAIGIAEALSTAPRILWLPDGSVYEGWISIKA